MNRINLDLTQINQYLSLPTKERANSDLSKQVVEAVEELNLLLNSEEIIQSLSYAKLQNMRQVMGSYLNSLQQKTDSLVMSIFRKCFKNPNVSSAENVIELIDSILIHDKHLLSHQINEISKSLINRNLSKDGLRKAVRDAIYLLAQKNPYNRSYSLGFVWESMRRQNTNSFLNEVLNDSKLFSTHELKTGVLSAPLNTLNSCLKSTQQKGQPLPIRNTALFYEEQLQALQEQRLYRLTHLSEVYGYTSQDKNQQAQSKFFPSVESIYVGVTEGTRKQTSSFESILYQVAKENQFTVVTDCSFMPDQSAMQNAFIVNSPFHTEWSQDTMDFSRDEIRIPFYVSKTAKEKGLSRTAQDEDDALNMNSFIHPKETEKRRNERDPIWLLKDPISQAPLSQTIDKMGAVWKKGCFKQGLHLAHSLGAKAVMNLTYNEGGNTLVGSRLDGSKYVIIGKDTVEMSRTLMEYQLGRPMSDQEIKMAFAIDYGIQIQDVFIVEQPAGFHLDMSMTIIGHNKVALNDSVAAFREFDKDRKEFLQNNQLSPLDEEKALAIAMLKKELEDKTEKELIAQGFEVVRVAGSFQVETAEGPPIAVMNFFNHISFVPPSKKPTVIALGVLNEQYEKKFIDMLKQGDARIDTLIFLPLEESIQSLELHGGIACRTKMM